MSPVTKQNWLEYCRFLAQKCVWGGSILQGEDHKVQILFSWNNQGFLGKATLITLQLVTVYIRQECKFQALVFLNDRALYSTVESRSLMFFACTQMCLGAIMNIRILLWGFIGPDLMGLAEMMYTSETRSSVLLEKESIRQSPHFATSI